MYQHVIFRYQKVCLKKTKTSFNVLLISTVFFTCSQTNYFYPSATFCLPVPQASPLFSSFRKAREKEFANVQWVKTLSNSFFYYKTNNVDICQHFKGRTFLSANPDTSNTTLQSPANCLRLHFAASEALTHPVSEMHPRTALGLGNFAQRLTFTPSL